MENLLRPIGSLLYRLWYRNFHWFICDCHKELTAFANFKDSEIVHPYRIIPSKFTSFASKACISNSEASGYMRSLT